MATFNDYLNELKTSRIRRPLIKLEFLRREDENPLFEVISDLRLDGNLSIKNGNGVRRTMGITLDNVNGQYFPSIDTNIWIASKVKLYFGLNINGEDFYVPQGVFVMDDPDVGGKRFTRLNVADKYALLDGSLGGELDTGLIIPNSTTLGNAIRSLMTISQDDNLPIIDVSLDAEPIPYDIIKEEGDTIGSALEELAFAFSANVFYNEEGYLVFEKDTPDSTKGSIWDFEENEAEVNYNSSQSKYKLSEVYNSVLVIGDNINGLTVRSKVQNNDLLSDTSIPNIGFERILVVKDNIIYTVAFAEQRAIYELKRATNALTQTSSTAVPIYHLDVDRVITITDSDINFTKKRLLIDSISIPFNNTLMSMTVLETFDIEL